MQLSRGGVTGKRLAPGGHSPLALEETPAPVRVGAHAPALPGCRHPPGRIPLGASRADAFTPARQVFSCGSRHPAATETCAESGAQGCFLPEHCALCPHTVTGSAREAQLRVAAHRLASRARSQAA